MMGILPADASTVDPRHPSAAAHMHSFLQLLTDTAVVNPCLLLNPTFHLQYSGIGDFLPLHFFSLLTTAQKLLIGWHNDNSATLKTLKRSHFASLRRRVNICLWCQSKQ